MHVAQGVKLFIGLKVDQKLREHLESASEINKRYFAAEDPQYLTFVEAPEGGRYIGRILDEQLSTENLDDVRRNVLSILGRIAPSVRPERALLILPCNP